MIYGPYKIARPEQSRQEDETGEKSVQKSTKRAWQSPVELTTKKWRYFFIAQQNKLKISW
jgi:hypothetical protein